MTSFFYDQVLDLSLTLGVIPEQYQAFAKKNTVLDLYLQRGAQRGQML
jgi:5-methyltetrahydropteroyltriglutamate--homocysteine methyltransferase